ncbi:chondroadherin-like protein [Pollicipes pollicipes]|uniref:chondroadherin-like protein n=1 Tax=Pollicipes pollicipes TaxID=41117 RepID=UPI001885618D|nr:chondroadherin-like protein [Pollicipes pollicipes]
MFDTLFGTSALICTDATPLAATCNCGRRQRQGPRSIDCAGRGLDNLPVGLTLPGGFSAVTFGENKLTEVKRGQFRWNPAVTTLNLSHNLVSTVDPWALAGLPVLRTLLLDHNQLTELKLKALQGVYDLAQLDLSFNRLRVLDSLLFVNTDIRELRLRHNPLVTLAPRLFLFVPRLRLLDLGGADLTALPADLFASSRLLETLLLPDNQLTAVPSETLAAAPGLSTLDLSGNRLESVSVDLAGNNLTGVSRDLLPWGRMEFVGVEQNPWICDCDMAWAADGAFPLEDESLVV